jgi:integrase
MTIRKENTKVRTQRVITSNVGNILSRIKSYSKSLKHEDFIFAHYSNSKLTVKDKIYKYYNELKQEVKLRYKDFDTELDIYSIRHYFITLHLRVAKTDMYSIARFCGTSVKEIERTYQHIKDDEVSRSVMKSSRSIRFGKDNDILIVEDGLDGEKTVRNLYDD